MKPKIGLKISSALYSGPGKVDSKVVELISKDPDFKFRRKELDKFKKALKGKDLSMHTQTKRVFTEKDDGIQEMELLVLKSEILACEYLKCKELVVHLKQEKLTSAEVKQFKEIIKFAKQHHVEILYEMNGKFIAKNFLHNLKQFPGLNVNLDIGHLNTAIVNKTLRMPVEEFLKKIKGKVVYLHLHNNDGEDNHQGLDEGSLDWRNILNQLDIGKVRKIISEVHDYQKMAGEVNLIEEYLEKRTKKPTPLSKETKSLLGILK
jgi:sugar phosphate isomerase/epimerase